MKILLTNTPKLVAITAALALIGMIVASIAIIAIAKSSSSATPADNQAEVDSNRAEFVGGCMSQDKSESYCQCAWTTMLDKYKWEGYMELSSEMERVGTKIEDSEVIMGFVEFSNTEIPNKCESAS